jgi:hypothetical protein
MTGPRQGIGRPRFGEALRFQVDEVRRRHLGLTAALSEHHVSYMPPGGESQERNSSPYPVLTVEGGQTQRGKSAGSNTSPRVSARAASRRYWAGSMPTSFAVSNSV